MKTKIKNFKNKQGGITLVALVITIIILLILAAISIQSLTNTGLFQKANEAKDKTKNATENQAKTLNEYEDAMNEYLSNSTAVKEQFKGKTVEEAIKYADLLSKDNNIELKDANINNIIIVITSAINVIPLFSGFIFFIKLFSFVLYFIYKIGLKPTCPPYP